VSLKIAIADDSAAIRFAFRWWIESYTNWQICGEAADSEAAVFLAQRLKPDLLVLDLSMPVMNGLDAARKIAFVSPKTRIVLFTGYASNLLTEAKSVGIRAVIPKGEASSVQDLISALREAASTFQAA
jgi:DNA-binding NarL/FixJ family response regulator